MARDERQVVGIYDKYPSVTVQGGDTVGAAGFNHAVRAAAPDLDGRSYRSPGTSPSRLPCRRLDAYHEMIHIATRLVIGQSLRNRRGCLLLRCGRPAPPWPRGTLIPCDCHKEGIPGSAESDQLSQCCQLI